ncbi:D-3-phosphoglycerate dehydrogenase [Enterobacter cloacae]|uniref:D-3-phosphoglycerate dehydrogenase n=1 Tax=Enterobacter cloacae TaxID=550 RepID=A0A377LTV5_ENTCL|nr:D-3-phosphoglycerate dehydrogenase [Enterobacter cloacae]
MSTFAAQYLQTNSQMGYVVIDIEADEDVAEKALQSMKAIPGRFARVCCTNCAVCGVGWRLRLTRPTLRFCRPGKRKRHPALFYQVQVLLGVTTAGNGTSHFSTGKASTA